MTLSPKEEAKKLVEQFMDIICPDGGALSYKQQQWQRAKQCALIDIKNTIEFLAEINNNESYNVSKYGNYYQQVKTEIELL